MPNFFLLNRFPSWACFGAYCCTLGLVAICGRFLFPGRGRNLIVIMNLKKEYRIYEVLISIMINLSAESQCFKMSRHGT